MHPTRLKIITALCSAGVFAGCASPGKIAEMKVTPKMDIRHAGVSADGYYALGRYHQGAQRFEEALKAYRQVLAIDRDHQQARNAIGILYAERGDYGQAVVYLREAVERSPRESHLFSNLGVALYLKGDYDEAAAALEQATSLDANNARAWNNYGRVMEKLGRPSHADVLFRRAQLLDNRPAAMQAAAQKDAAQFPVRPQADKPQPQNTGGESWPPLQDAPHGLRTEVRQIVPGVFEIRHAATAPAGGAQAAASAGPLRALPAPATPHAVREPAVKKPPHAAKIEISNGNGINGMAKSVAKIIGGGYLQVVRLTNQARFNVDATRIEYGKGHEAAAREVASHLGRHVELQSSNDMRYADIRVILGRDIQHGRLARTPVLGNSGDEEKRAGERG